MTTKQINKYGNSFVDDTQDSSKGVETPLIGVVSIEQLCCYLMPSLLQNLRADFLNGSPQNYFPADQYGVNTGIMPAQPISTVEIAERAEAEKEKIELLNKKERKQLSDVDLKIEELLSNPRHKAINKIAKTRTFGHSKKSGFEPIIKKHSNKPGLIDHSGRIDVRTKTYLRSLGKILIRFSKEAIKGKRAPDRVIGAGFEYLKKNYPKIGVNKIFLFEVAGPILKKKLRKDFRKTVKDGTLLDEEEKVLLLESTSEFFKHYNNLSLSESRSILYKHPVFKVAKDLITDNKLYFNEFWDRIIKTRRKEIDDLEAFKTKILKDIDNLISY